MSGSGDSTSSKEWTRFWAQAQEQAWESWRLLMAQQDSTRNPEPNQLWKVWSEGLEQLWQGRASHLSGTNQEVFTRLLDQGKGFFFLSHQMLRAFEQMQQQFDSEQDWKPALRDAVNQAQEQLRHWAGASSGQAALWGLPAEMWERMAAALSFTPGDWSQVLKVVGRASGEPSKDGVGRGLDWLPALGIGRDWQLRLKEGAQRSEAYREAWQAYSAKLVEVGVLALDYLYARLVQAGETSKPLTELRELYDLWVECAELAYAEIAATEEFARIQAAVINAAVALKQHLQDALERVANANNLPTRRELDAAHHAIKEMRDELEALRSQVERLSPPRRDKKPGGDR